MNPTKRRVLSPAEINLMLIKTKNPGHRIMLLLLADCGLRVGECVSVRYSDFNLKKRTITVPGMRRGEAVNRQICIPERLLQELGAFFVANVKRIDAEPGGYLFCSTKIGVPIGRGNVNDLLERVSQKTGIAHLYPHLLRKTFAINQLAKGMKVRSLKRLMGHSETASTMSYQPTEEIIAGSKDSADDVASNFEGGKENQFQNWKLTGRSDELSQLSDFARRGINTILIGPTGVGKSYLLEVYEEWVKTQPGIHILKIDDVSELKTTLAQLLIYILRTDQKGVYDFLFAAYDYEQVVAKVSRQSMVHLTKEIMRVTEAKYYTLLIDNVDLISARAVKILELFKDHFTIVTAARKVPLSRSSFLWNFSIIRVAPLRRPAAIELIGRLAAGLAPTHLQLFRNHVYEQTNGNPRAITEMVDRYRKEPKLTDDVVRELRHTGSLPEYDVTFLLLIFLACVACLRYLNHEIQNASFRVLGGIALVFLFITRYFFRYSKRTQV